MFLGDFLQNWEGGEEGIYRKRKEVKRSDVEARSIQNSAKERRKL